ncbi:MAG: hypothetical protein H0X47_21530 [Nitrospirales bacterium]|nr:hypothetical protein [Nitrospirales bacterium]
MKTLLVSMLIGLASGAYSEELIHVTLAQRKMQVKETPLRIKYDRILRHYLSKEWIRESVGSTTAVVEDRDVSSQDGKHPLFRRNIEAVSQLPYQEQRATVTVVTHGDKVRILEHFESFHSGVDGGQDHVVGQVETVFDGENTTVVETLTTNDILKTRVRTYPDQRFVAGHFDPSQAFESWPERLPTSSYSATSKGLGTVELISDSGDGKSIRLVVTSNSGFRISEAVSSDFGSVQRYEYAGHAAVNDLSLPTSARLTRYKDGLPVMEEKCENITYSLLGAAEAAEAFKIKIPPNVTETLR